MPPVILIIGPSGVGKSYVSGLLAREWRFHYWRIYGFKENGLPSAWDGRGELIHMPTLISAAQNRQAEAKATGIVVSIAPEDVFELRQLVEARTLGATPVVLWGTPDQCVQARKERSRKNNVRFNERDMPRYWRKNTRAFDAYGSAQYADFREDAFQPDGSRWPDEHWLKRIELRLAG
jgi:hypothetical protein